METTNIGRDLKKMNTEREPKEYLVCIVCGMDMCVCEPEDCPDCYHGESTDCWDDLCQGDEGCIHGDNYACRTCEGEGIIYPEMVTEEERAKRLPLSPHAVKPKEDGLPPTTKVVGIRPNEL